MQELLPCKIFLQTHRKTNMEKYQITKSIRFKLEPVKASQFEKEVENLKNAKEEEKNLSLLVSTAQDLSKLLKEYIYTDPNHEKKKFKSTVTVHYRWLREFTKDKYFELRMESPTEEPEKKATGHFASLASRLPQKTKKLISQEKQFKLYEVKYLPKVFEDFFKGWDKNIQDLSNIVSRPKESLTRKSEIGKVVLKFTERNMLLFLEHFISESKEKDSSHLEFQLKDRLKEFKEVLEKVQKWAMPSQSTGFELAKASFNYYTINKNPKDFEKEKKEIEEKLFNYINDSSKSILSQKNLLKSLGIVKKEKEDTKYYFLYEINEQGILQKTKQGSYVTLDLLYKILKTYKAKQKQEFKAAMDKNPSYEDVIKIYNLFAPIDPNKNQDNLNVFNKYKELTKEIQKIGNDINKVQKDSLDHKRLNDKLSNLKQQRGKLFFKGSSKKNNQEPKEYFERFVEFCKVYREVAMKRGRLIARLKGIEKEKIDSQRLQYWAFLVEDKTGHQVVLIPKAQAKKAYQKISCFGETQTGSPAVYYFESLTYRALKKLCFKIQDNTFQEGILNDQLIQKNWKTYFQDIFDKNPNSDKRIGEHLFKKENGERDEEKLIAFYKDILRCDYVTKNREDGKIVLPNSLKKEVLETDFNTEQEFRIALEKCCYLRKRIVPKDELQKILSECDAQIFSITSYDLQKVDKSNLKAHTKLWLDFWKKENEQQRFPIRLNPEIKIFWREPKATRIAKYGKGTELYDERKKNRYLYPQYTLVTSFLENALQSEINYRFLDVEKKKENINEFNNKVNTFLKSKTELWLYGIDTGIVELASLCLIKKDKTPQMFEVLKVKEEYLNYEKTGFLQKGTPKPYKAIQNLSYFLNKELYKQTFLDDKFEEEFDKIFTVKQVSALDLSVAKVISGRIVINGDIPARLNLSLSNARRKIIEALIQNPNVQLSEENYKIKIANEIIFRGRKQFNEIKSWDEIKNTLNKFFQKDKDNPAKVQEDINKHRKVIAANITGVIHFLYKKFPGIITIEYLDQNKVESHRKDFEGIVDNPVEKALYRKFQTEGLVPPVSELWSIKTKDSQIGIIYYADSDDKEKGGHGLRCPKCEKKAYSNSNDDKYKSDKQNKIFECKHCGYDNHKNPMGLDGLDSNDKVAAYNIAKRGLEIINKKT